MTTELPEGSGSFYKPKSQKNPPPKKTSCNAWTKRGAGEGGHVARIWSETNKSSST